MFSSAKRLCLARELKQRCKNSLFASMRLSAPAVYTAPEILEPMAALRAVRPIVRKLSSSTRYAVGVSHSQLEKSQISICRGMHYTRALAQGSYFMSSGWQPHALQFRTRSSYISKIVAAAENEFKHSSTPGDESFSRVAAIAETGAVDDLPQDLPASAVPLPEADVQYDDKAYSEENMVTLGGVNTEITEQSKAGPTHNRGGDLQGGCFTDGTVKKADKSSRRKLSNQSADVNKNVGERLSDLLSVPGIGPRNMQKLQAKGIKEFSELKQLYRDKFAEHDSNEMVKYLRKSVGIIHKNHAASIASYVKDKVEDEQLESTGSEDGIESKTRGRKANNRLTFCVEGNISVGKSTFLQRIANETIELQDLVEIVPEPIDKWQDVGPSHLNILKEFYNDPPRYAYTFQNYVFITRLLQERGSAGGIKPLRLMERSVFSDRMVFVRAVHEAKWMNEMEVSIYDSWFDPVVSELPGLVPDGFIYLRAQPHTCHQRLQSRNRHEETSVSLEYLQGLHEKHEQWLLPAERGGGTSSGLLAMGKWPPGMDAMPPAVIQDRVFCLHGEHLHSSIQQVPALILDCDINIDFSRDVEAKAQYANQVAAFFEYVKKMKAMQKASDASAGDLVAPPATSPLYIPGRSTSPLISPAGGLLSLGSGSNVQQIQEFLARARN